MVWNGQQTSQAFQTSYNTRFFLIAVWKDLYTVYTSALLPIASKFGPQEVNICNQLCGLFHWSRKETGQK